MIKGIMSGGRYMSVSGSASSTHISSYSGAQGVGNMRYNTSTQNIEVYDGTTWINMNIGYPTVALTGEAESLLDWAKQKRAEEAERDQLAQSNPAIKDLLNQIKEKEDQIKMVMTLLKSPGDSPVELMGSPWNKLN
jgi:hypothetical protein